MVFLFLIIFELLIGIYKKKVKFQSSVTKENLKQRLHDSKNVQKWIKFYKKN